MSQYKLVYYSGMNMNLVQGASEIVEADSFNDALSLKCSWPVFEARDHLSAAAQ
ncbi:MAG: GMP synthase, partial [Desulfovibrionaceae bacterium]|nr:GMP synthase [Desulfovibrionaceae bacterium]